MSDIEQTVVRTIEKILRAARKDVEVRLDAALYDELTLDSLDVAELSVALEDAFGRDPFNEGFEPRTVREVIAFYDGDTIAADHGADT